MNPIVELLGIRIDNLTTDEIKQCVVSFLKNKQKGYIVTPNAFHIVLLREDEEFRKAYEDALMVLPDGISLIIVSKLFNSPLKMRCAGSDLFLEICKIASQLNKSIFLLGGVNDSEKIAQQKLKDLFPNIEIYSYSPPFGFEKDEKETRKIIDIINRTNSEILFIFLGAPKSEKWIYKNISALNISLAFCFGAALDFFSGVKKRAPKWIQSMGFEWFWRLIHEPKRLWKRYLIGNAVFILLVLKELIKKVNKKLFSFKFNGRK
jgi:N-acetylglucosaminyldiphosphoundecaprenol N-acetyl-beta-D-mannosaminyltransferase